MAPTERPKAGSRIRAWGPYLALYAALFAIPAGLVVLVALGARPPPVVCGDFGPPGGGLYGIEPGIRLILFGLVAVGAGILGAVTVVLGLIRRSRMLVRGGLGALAISGGIVLGIVHYAGLPVPSYCIWPAQDAVSSSVRPDHQRA